MGQKLTRGIIFLVIIIIVFLVVGAFLLISSRFKGDFPNLEKTTTFNNNDLAKLKQECNKSPIIPKGGYESLLTDVHVHSMPQGNQIAHAVQLLKEMNESGIDRVAVQPNHSPGETAKLQHLDTIWGQISRVCPRIIALIYGFNPDDNSAWQYVQKQLDTGNFGGAGEIEFQHGNLPIKHDPESVSMQKIYQMLEDRNLALHFQASLEKDPSLREKLLRIIKAHPKLNFVWFGCSMEGEFINLPNLYCDTFFHSQSRGIRNEMLKKSLIGSDASPTGVFNPGAQFLPYNNVGEAAIDTSMQLETLPKDIADALAFGNFDKIWPKQKLVN